MKATLEVPYVPFGAQIEAHMATEDTVLLAGGWGSGKTWWLLAEALRNVAANPGRTPLYHRAKYQLRHFAGVYWRDPDQLRLGLVVAQGAVTSALVVVFALATTWRRMALELLLNLGIWQVVLQMPPLAEVRLARAWTPS